MKVRQKVWGTVELEFDMAAFFGPMAERHAEAAHVTRRVCDACGGKIDPLKRFVGAFKKGLGHHLFHEECYEGEVRTMRKEH